MLLVSTNFLAIFLNSFSFFKISLTDLWILKIELKKILLIFLLPCWRLSTNRAKTDNWEVKAFVEATPISGPAKVGIVKSLNLAMELLKTLTTEIVFLIYWNSFWKIFLCIFSQGKLTVKQAYKYPVSYTHLTLPTICSV